MDNKSSNIHKNLIQMKVDRIRIWKRCYTHFENFWKVFSPGTTCRSYYRKGKNILLKVGQMETQNYRQG